jgi:hypothetical protein
MRSHAPAGTTAQQITGRRSEWKNLSALGLLSADVKNEERISKLVADLHAPVVPGLQLAIDILENLSGDHGPLFPRRVLVRQLLTHTVGLGNLMVDIEKIPRHVGAMSGST